MASVSPMQRTLKVLKSRGLKVDIAEHYSPFPKPFGRRIDLFHIIDVLVLTPEGILGIQVCGTDFKSHVIKITETERENALAWLKTPGTMLEIYSWRKLVKKRGMKAKYWDCKIKRITLEDLE